MSLRRRLWPLVGAIAGVVFVVAVVFPSHSLLDQRRQMEAEEAKIEVLTEQNHELAGRVAELRTDSEIERLAREQYSLVRPGEEAYAILPGPAEAAPDPAVPQEAAPPARPWWSRAWDAATFWD